MKVAIVGAGLSGLVTAKECLDNGLEVDVFEALSVIGGQWAYAEPDPVTGEVMSSVYHGVVLNSCRDTGGFSDFPMDPAKFAPYFSQRKHLKFLQEYAEHFDLRRHVLFETKVTRCEQLPDGHWSVAIISKDGKTDERVYGALFACTGQLSIPKFPDIQGLREFTGDMIHSHVYRTPGRYEGKRVAIIGLGNSAVDISCETAPQAKSVDVVTRKGGWVLPRYVLGKPIEAYNNRFGQMVLPEAATEWLQRLLLDTVQGKLPSELLPKHRLLATQPLIRGDFLERVQNRELKVHRTHVDRITATGLVLGDGTELEVDCIILCTGYKLEFPYLPEDSWKSTNPELADIDSATDWYNLCLPLMYKNLFYIGILDIAGPQTMVSEAQARWANGVLSGKIKLPSPEEMAKAIVKMQTKQQKSFIRQPSLTMCAPLVEYCDELMRPLGATPKFWRLVSNIFTSGSPFQAMRLLSGVYTGVTAPAQYRIFGEHSCPELATATVLRTNSGAKTLSRKEAELLKASKKQ